MLPTGGVRRCLHPARKHLNPDGAEIVAGCSTTTAALTLVTTRTPPWHHEATPRAVGGMASAPAAGVDGAVSSAPAFDTLLVAGSDLYPRARVPGDLADAARIPAAVANRVASICTGAFVLASADIDLALALVEEDHGPQLARDVARALVVYMQCTGGQSQFSAPLQGPLPRSPALRKITDLVAANPRGDHSLGELAKHLNVSTRHLTRLFHHELSTTPARYVENIRFDMARALLDQGLTATQRRGGVHYSAGRDHMFP